MSLDRMHYTCPRCMYQTPIPDDWKSGDDPPTCGGCGENREKRAARRKKEWEDGAEKRAKWEAIAKEALKVNDDDRARWAEKGIDGPFLLVHNYIPTYGRQGYMVTCSLCDEHFRLYEWSYHGCGKKCPGCGHTFGGGYRLMGRS